MTKNKKENHYVLTGTFLKWKLVNNKKSTAIAAL
ncbi:hypothetical protein EV282_0471 [Fictibacillus sp. BK138]|nr:hypothetical protein EV282_0471 [Fictibacillus sp. BK138]